MQFQVGAAKITRIEETYGATYPLRKIFPDCTDELIAQHRDWLSPHHYDADNGLIKLSVHSWLLEIGRKKILIDACCGNNKVKPDRRGPQALASLVHSEGARLTPILKAAQGK